MEGGRQRLALRLQDAVETALAVPVPDCCTIRYTKLVLAVEPRIEVRERISAKHPDASEADVRAAWKSRAKCRARVDPWPPQQVAVGFDGKGRILQVATYSPAAGEMLAPHAMTVAGNVEKGLRHRGRWRDVGGMGDAMGARRGSRHRRRLRLAARTPAHKQRPQRVWKASKFKRASASGFLCPARES